MLDAVVIFTKGGVVLWSYYFINFRSDVFPHLVEDYLLQERAAECVALIGTVTMKWQLIPELDSVIAIAYETAGSSASVFSYVDSLLADTARGFVKFVGDMTDRKSPGTILLDHPDFEFNNAFVKLLEKHESRKEGTKKSGSGPKVFTSTKKGMVLLEKRKSGGRETSSVVEAEDDEADDKGRARKSQSQKGHPATTHRAIGIQKVTQKAMNSLDYSKPSETSTGLSSAPAHRNLYLDENVDSSEEVAVAVSSSSSDEAEDAGRMTRGAAALTSIFSSVTSAVMNVTGNKLMTSEEVDIAMAELKKQLIVKNVAQDVAIKLTESVGVALVGTRTATWTSVASQTKTELRKALKRILTPKKSVDLHRAVAEARARGKVFSIVFVGVNGVGKSTSLAKICYQLKQDYRVMIAACDTFRSGAVEQLRTHSRNLDVPLFEQGYGKDAAMIAKYALESAKKDGYDVLLIDTAGRMQDNEPLMKSLANLVSVNQPDLILFVGEALVGNDAVDQLQKFNRTLCEQRQGGSNIREIDGILLTKFDTVDDKVGAAVSMVYQTGQPILFVGTGQKYTNLRKLHVSQITDVLLS